MSPEAVRVKDALILICARAGCSPGDGSAAAGQLVRAWIQAHWMTPPAHDTINCPTNALLARLAKVPNVVVLKDRAFLPKSRELVLLPNAVVAGVKLFDVPGAMLQRVA